MSHVRTQIRDAVVGALTPVAPVHASRFYAVQPDELPAFFVYTGDEQIEGDLDTLSRALQVIVEIIAAGPDFEDTLDEYIALAETALTGDLTALIVHLQPVAITLTASAEGSTTIGRARMTFEAAYRTSYDDPETSI